MQKQKIIAIVGPTASGKTSLGIYLAQKYGGEVVSADSRQVYKGLNIGTGKVTKKEMGGVPHHLLDVVHPKKQFSASDFKAAGEKALTHILQKENLPIVVGGTGFYVDTLLGRLTFPNVPPNQTLRAKLEKKSVETLFKLLQQKDPERAKSVEPENKRRIIRALEIAQYTPEAKPVAEPVDVRGFVQGQATILWLGLNPGIEKLKKNIHTRLLARTRAGLVAEAKKLHAGGLSYKRMRELGLEYRFLADLLEKKLSKEETLERLERAINDYARRQIRWFKRNKEIHWVANKTEALTQVKKFISGR